MWITFIWFFTKKKCPTLHIPFPRIFELSCHHKPFHLSASKCTIIQKFVYQPFNILFFCCGFTFIPIKLKYLRTTVIVFINCKISKNENEFNTMYNIIIYVCHSEDTLPNKYILQEMGSNLACVLIHLFLKRKEADSIQELIMNDKERLTFSFNFEFRV